MRFAIKALGDHTHSLKKELKIGQDVIVEGPWGYLDFNIQSERQVWVAGGIGITPFISQLEYLKTQATHSALLIYGIALVSMMICSTL